MSLGNASLSLQWLAHPGMQICISYRLSRAFYLRGWLFCARIVAFMGRTWHGNDIHYKAEIAPGVCFPHGQAVVIGEGVEIASKCNIFQHVSLGAHEFQQGAPKLKEGVNVYPSTVISGPVEIGEYCRIGPCVSLTHSVESHTRVRSPEPLTRRNPH